MTQALSPPRMLIYGTLCAGLLAGFAWTVMPPAAEWSPWQTVILACLAIAGFLAGAWIEVRAHRHAVRQFEGDRTDPRK